MLFEMEALLAEIKRQRQALESAFKHDLIGIKAHTDETLIRLESKMDKSFASVDIRFAEMKGEILVLKWMLGVIVAGVIALVLKAFF